MNGGSGLKSYSIYYFDNGGGFTPLSSNTSLTSTLFTGKAVGTDGVDVTE